MKVSRADWAALVPWKGVQGKPDFLLHADGLIHIDDVAGLREILNSLSGGSGAAAGGSVVVFGSAAFADTSYFQPAWTARTQQMGQEPIVAGQQTYDIAFTEAMNDVPKVYTQVSLSDGTSEVLFGDTDMITNSGFRVVLSAIPSAAPGFIQWKAQVEDQV